MDVNKSILEGMILEDAFNEVIHEGLLDKLFNKKDKSKDSKYISKEEAEKNIRILEQNKQTLIKIFTECQAELKKAENKFLSKLDCKIQYIPPEKIYSYILNSIKHSKLKPHYITDNIVMIIYSNSLQDDEYEKFCDEISDNFDDYMYENKVFKKYGEYESSFDGGDMIIEILINKDLLKLTLD
jgi:hypothetical protein